MSRLLQIALFLVTAVTAQPTNATGSCPVVTLLQRSSYNSYTALGDSYASGLGAQSRLKECQSGDSLASPNCTFTGNSGYPACNKDIGSYAYQFAQRHVTGDDFRFLPCSGANTTTVTNSQLPLIGSPDLLTVQVGGDDYGSFSVEIGTCLGYLHDYTCSEALNTVSNDVPTILTNVDKVLAAINARVPSTTTKALVGYVQFFGYDTDCEFNVTMEDRQRLNDIIVTANKGLQQLAAQRGFLFVNPDLAYAGHRWCDTQPPWWIIDTLLISGNDTAGKQYSEIALGHPTTQGQQAYLNALEQALHL